MVFITLTRVEKSISNFQNKIYLNFYNSNIFLVYQNQKYLKKSLFSRFKSVKEFLILNNDYAFVFTSEERLRIVVNLKSFIVLNYISIYIKKSKGNSSIIEFLTVYYKMFSYLCNILFFPVVDFSSDKYSLKFRPFFDYSESIINIKNFLSREKYLNFCIDVDILYDFGVHNKLWLFKNFPAYKSLILFFFKNFLFSKDYFYLYNVFSTFFTFSLNGLVCNKFMVLFFFL